MSVTKARIEELIDVGRQLPQTQLPTLNFLLEGMYLRQCCIPAGTAFVGREHKKPHYFIVAKGRAVCTTDEGVAEVYAGMIFLVKPGSQRVGITLEDSVFITVHRTKETNLEAIEADLVVFDPKARFGVSNQLLPNLIE